MRTVIYTITFIFLGLSYSAYAQNVAPITANQVNGNDAIEKLRDARYSFNKSIIKSKKAQLSYLPKSEYIFDKPGTHTVLFEGVKFVIKENNVVSVNGITASSEVLAMVTEKLMTLDRLQYFYSEKSNQEYLSSVRSLPYIYNSDRQFFSTLRILSTTVRHIAALAKPKTSSIEFELGIAKLREPNIDRTILTDEYKTTSLTAK
ncbi:hypothetical protein ACFOG5_12175 [Pedobacter fastidiosus]|uniref:Outer membrane lipoprotein-sorting protein n=1 Tax=Pedobacter fastidiosus TaxID=2765361 RepID=A0ABR7KM99_9SPHI|nr:hypothetical protein [Pedobacter fastidiosus]MBC6109202.1 hypothetical protein [Pedobacter fastidiosus]